MHVEIPSPDERVLYLEQMMTFVEQETAEVRHRIRCAWYGAGTSTSARTRTPMSCCLRHDHFFKRCERMTWVLLHPRCVQGCCFTRERKYSVLSLEPNASVDVGIDSTNCHRAGTRESRPSKKGTDNNENRFTSSVRQRSAQRRRVAQEIIPSTFSLVKQQP